MEIARKTFDSKAYDDKSEQEHPFLCSKYQSLMNFVKY